MSQDQRDERKPAALDGLIDEITTFTYKEVEDSAKYVDELRDQAQPASAEGFLREIIAWQEMRSS